eukprot:maker-scaffold_1-snap-gene-27.48-mRNA-1 protein AED:0.00 eAED:0.00 QI:66/1/1/1/1/1/2/94/708
MEGFLYKQRYHPSKKLAKSRKRYVVMDLETEELRFYADKGNPDCHKTVPLDQISDVIDYDDTGFLVTMRFVATAEMANACFLFHAVASEEISGENQKVKWVKLLKARVNCAEDGLHLVKKHQESIHLRYETTGHSKSSVLGTGMSGDVRLIRRKIDGKFFALKVVSLSGCSNAKLGSLRRELDIHKSLDHPHISRFQEYFIEPKLCCRLVMELMEGGELFERLQKHRHFSEDYSGKLLCVMLQALKYLKKNSIVHRDLKLENWMYRNKLKSNANHETDTDIVLIDFGLSRRYRSTTEIMTRKLGTSYYIAPEVLQGHYAGNSCDLWSAGVITYMMLTGKPPFPGKDDNEIKMKVAKVDPDFKLEKYGITTDCIKFLQGMLNKNLEERFTMEQAIDNSWVKAHELKLDSKAVSKYMAKVTNRLQAYSKYSELKRLVLEVIAFSLDYKESNFKHLTEVFKWIDKDHDGYVTCEDLIKFFAEKRKHLREVKKLTVSDLTPEDILEIKKVFDALDEENTGLVHVNEFIAGCLDPKYHQNKIYLQEAFNRIDQDGKGKIDINDLRILLGKTANEERVNKIWNIVFGEIKEINFRQFVKFMKTDHFYADSDKDYVSHFDSESSEAAEGRANRKPNTMGTTSLNGSASSKRGFGLSGVNIKKNKSWASLPFSLSKRSTQKSGTKESKATRSKLGKFATLSFRRGEGSGKKPFFLL